MLGNNHTAPCKTAHHVACNVRRGPAYDNTQREILHFNHNFVCPVCTLVLLLDTELSLFSLLSLELLSGSTQTAFNTKQSYATYWIRERYRQRPTVRQRAQSRLMTARSTAYTLPGGHVTKSMSLITSRSTVPLVSWAHMYCSQPTLTRHVFQIKTAYPGSSSENPFYYPVCMRTCVRACVRACVCGCVFSPVLLCEFIALKGYQAIKTYIKVNLAGCSFCCSHN